MLHLLQPSNKILFYILYVYPIFKVSWYEDGISSRWAFGGSVRAPMAVLPSLSMLNTFAYTRQLLAIVTYKHISGSFNLHQERDHEFGLRELCLYFPFPFVKITFTRSKLNQKRKRCLKGRTR